MKKICALLAAVLLTLSGCAAEKKIQPVKNGSFVCSVDIQYGDVQSSANLTRKPEGGYTIDLLSPDALRGMQFQLDGKSAKLNYMGITIDVTRQLPQAAAVVMIAQVLDTLLSLKEVAANLSGQNLTFSGNTDTFSYQVKMNSDDDTLASIEVPTANLKVTVNSFQYT